MKEANEGTLYARLITATKQGNLDEVRKVVEAMRAIYPPEQVNELLIKADIETGQSY